MPARRGASSRYLTRLTQDERIYAVGLCLPDTKQPLATPDFPEAPRLRPAAGRSRAPTRRSCCAHARGPLHVAVKTLDVPAAPGAELVLVHDMRFAVGRSEETKRYLFYFFVALGAIVALITVVIAQLSWRGWVQGLRALLRGEGLVRPASAADVPELRPLARDVRELVRQLEAQYRPRDESQLAWTPETLRSILKGELRGHEVIVVSNREPYIHVEDARRHPHAAAGERPRHRARAGDARLLRHLDRAWQRIGRPRRPSTSTITIAVPPDAPAYQLRRIWLTPEEEAGYYSGFANEGLWPLCHIAHVRPTFRSSDFEHYRAVNAKFAEAVQGGSEVAPTRSSSCRTITSRCCRA